MEGLVFLGPAFDAGGIGPAERAARRGKGRRPFPLRAKPAPTGTSEVLRKRHQIKDRQRENREKEGMEKGYVGDTMYQMNYGIRWKGRCPI
jgi:hypothetical protein